MMSRPLPQRQDATLSSRPSWCAAAQTFDALALMKVGGRMIYHGHLGPRSAILITYFEVSGLR